MDQTNLIDYLRIADKHYEEEKSRVEHILTWDVGQSVLKTFREEIFFYGNERKENLEEGLKGMMDSWTRGVYQKKREQGNGGMTGKR